MGNIIDTYHKLHSIKATHKETGVSECKIRKILVDAGEYDSPRANQVQKLSNSGLTARQIAATLGISVSAVNSYLPYNKGEYNAENPSPNAIRIKRHRAKKGRSA